MTNALRTCLLVTNVKNNTLVKLLKTFVADGIITSLKVSFKRGEKCIQEYLYNYFESEGHIEFLDDVSITLIDKTDGFNPTKRENYWMRTLKTYAPYGLNVVDSI